MADKLHHASITQLIKACPLLDEVISGAPVFWLNPEITSVTEALRKIPFTPADVEDAAARLNRFCSYIAKVFPETEGTEGTIESPLQKIANMKKAIQYQYEIAIPGALYLKMDSHLPISGSIKARGGIYEVLKFAETIAMDNGFLTTSSDYGVLGSKECRDLFRQYAVMVGSTGNLGLSIGIIGAKLGFQVTVHMSADAKKWKKDMLRAKGVSVVEYDGDYSRAVAEGRVQAANNPRCHFIDDENSRDLFLGYAVAAERLKVQFQKQSVRVDGDHPLFVYLPCGVGGGPGGITFGLKLAFGDNVHCFFAEPTQAPAMLVGLATGRLDDIGADQIGIENRTIADGLAVSRPSGLVSRTMQPLLTGVFTVEDREMYSLLSLLAEAEYIRLEPSAVVGFSGVARYAELVQQLSFSARQLQCSTHLVWGTGGSMVPEEVWNGYLKQAKRMENKEMKHSD